MRTISVKIPSLPNLVKVETSANTLLEFKSDVAKSEHSDVISFDNVKFVDIKTMNEVSMDQAILPSGDLYLLAVPVKSKSGVDVNTLNEIDELGYNDARKLGSQLNKENGAELDLSGRRDDIVPRIKEYVESQKTSPSEQVNTIAGNLKTAIELINEAMLQIKELKPEDRKAIEYAIPGMTMEELAEREEEILNGIK